MCAGSAAPAYRVPSVTAAAGRGLGIELPHAGQADGEFSFDPLLRDLAAHAGKATARSTAKNIEYPSAHRRLAGSPWAWRPSSCSPAPSRRP